MESHGPLKPISGYIMPFRFSAGIQLDQGNTGFINHLGRGTGQRLRVVYFPADIDRCHGRERLPDHGRLLQMLYAGRQATALP